MSFSPLPPRVPCHRLPAILWLGLILLGCANGWAATVTPFHQWGSTPGDPFDVSQGIVVTGNSHLDEFSTSSAYNMFGGYFGDAEPANTLFSRWYGTCWVRFHTPKPVSIIGYNVYFNEDGYSSERATSHFKLWAGSSNDALTVIADVSLNVPYTTYYGGSDSIQVSDQFAPLLAQYFYVEFTPASSGSFGPRINEFDAIANPLPLPAALPGGFIGLVSMAAWGRWRRLGRLL